jgi:protein-tyrosine phosphatase
MTARPIGVLFVCYANIVRSPLAAGVFAHRVAARNLADRFRIDSAGVAADPGYPPHHASVAIATSHGIALSGTSRQLRRDDLFEFDHVLVLDRLVAAEIRRLTAGSAFGPLSERPPAKIRLLASLADPTARGEDLDVRDPMRAGFDGFRAAFEQIDRACAALLDELA